MTALDTDRGTDVEVNLPVSVAVAAELDTTPTQVALAWLLGHSPVVLPIPGTARLDHLEENVAAESLQLTREQRDRLDVLSEAA